MSDDEQLTEQQQIIQNVLAAAREAHEETALASDDEELFKHQQQDKMPTGLSTPVSVMKKEKDEKEKEKDKKKKKKKKKKSKTADLPEAGADINDDYAEKYNEDPIENPFDPERPASRRLEYAIWKYKKNHRFSESKKAIFDSYLRFGGVETGQKAFMGRTTGADAPDDPEAEQDFEMAKTVTDVVPDLEEDDDDVEISFSKVAQVYLGNFFVRKPMFITLQEFHDAPAIVDAFLRYLQIRNVCPEYADDIAHAREIAAKAKIELPMCKRATNVLPGNFNKACSLLFGGQLQSAFSVQASWMESASAKVLSLIDDCLADTAGMTLAEARQIVKPRVDKVDKTLVVDERYTRFVKIADIGSFDPESASDELVSVTLAEYEDETIRYPICLETSIVKELLIGMVLTVDLRKLNNDVWYLDNPMTLMPTFYMVDEFEDEDE
ncbi:Argonaute siRNA chaperone complex subunit Arb1-domain-containing protein [Radiomyces spectabilis]|uniref:Argonaute siRNA chaperone complex subunit Arb1-domain-containing protein n=1 Tax=Radiomyces spectabilis TaxID=64574 RepID=UPI00221EFB6C|nr:Argonaute siRNA chaperone complex subunit Arb1-domain-containing protein [Radiomyces spectabilis]KAI8384244.1 Argonaute siRNA chaperone complex subunit Arb1-domain-containing protein [Radiomyces spectabilis]